MNRDILDVRDLIEQFEVLELEDATTEGLDDFTEKEYRKLKDLLGELCSNGGDHKWRGNWYPTMLIPDSYFESYARDLADDLGLLNDHMTWPYTCIDWEKAARELQQDYSTVDYDGITYWYR